MVMCSVCGVCPAARRGACWGCYSKFRREGLLDAVGPRSDTSTRFAAAPSVSEALRALVGRLSPAARLQLHEATRPTPRRGGWCAVDEEVRCPDCGSRVKVNADGRARAHNRHRAMDGPRCPFSGDRSAVAVLAAERVAVALGWAGRHCTSTERRVWLHTAREALASLRAWESLHGPVRLCPEDAKRREEADASWAHWGAVDDVLARFLTPAAGDPPFAVLNARVEDALLLLPDGAVDVVDADPPYGTGQWQRAEAGSGSDPKAVHRQAEWDRWDPSWIPEALRVARGPVSVCHPNDRIEELLRLGREMGVAPRLHMWVKPDPRPRFERQPAYGFEPVCVYRSNLLDGGEVDYTVASAPRANRDHEAEGHPHQKPLELPRRLIRQGCPPGGTVLALFAGSGTSAEAALLEGRRVLAVEADPAWCERITARCARAAERLRREPALPLLQASLPLEAA